VRRKAFFVWAWILALFFILLFAGLTLFTVGSWLAGQDSATNPVVDIGFFALGGLVVGVGIATQLRSPELRIAGVQQAMIGLLALVAAGLIGAREEPFWGGLLFLAAAVVLAALHPTRAELLKFKRRVSAPLALLAAAAAIPSAGYAAGMLRAARMAGASCFLGRCAHGDRFAEMAALVTAMVLLGLLAAFKNPGWLVPALSASASALLIGFASIVLPDVPGSLGRLWGALTVVWGVLLALAAGSEARATRQRSGVEAR
jgi:hypothetical protein